MTPNIPVPKDTFVISKLAPILPNDIDTIDALLISDYHSKDKKWYSKKFTIQQLVTYLTTQNSAISILIDTNIKNAAKPDGVIKPIIDNSVNSKINVETMPGGSIDTAIMSQISTQIEYTGIIGKAITNNVSTELSVQATSDKGILKPIISSQVSSIAEDLF